VVNDDFHREIREHPVEVRKVFDVEQELHMPPQAFDPLREFFCAIELHAGFRQQGQRAARAPHCAGIGGWRPC
jgi:hypothetical protein